MEPRYMGQVFAIPQWAREPWAGALEWGMRLGGAGAFTAGCVAAANGAGFNISFLALFGGLVTFYVSWNVRQTRLGAPRIYLKTASIVSTDSDPRPVIGTEADYEVSLKYSGWLGIFRRPKRLPDTQE